VADRAVCDPAWAHHVGHSDGERSFEVELDFCAHRLRIHLEGGEQRMLALEPKTVVSPVHFFWGAMDLAVTRFSGRTAPRHPGGAPNVGDWVMVEGYSHELSSAGFWPGGEGEGMFYVYAYPEPAGFKEHRVRPGEAFYYEDGGQFVLAYEAVRCAPDPDATLLGFLQDTYEAAAQHGRWDREALEDDPARRAAPR